MGKKFNIVAAHNQKIDEIISETFSQEEIRLVLNYRSLQSEFQSIMFNAIAHMTKTVGKKAAIRLVQTINDKGGVL
jgi:hypothetical protein